MRTLNVVMAAIFGIALISVATGCDGNKNNSNPKSSWLQDDDLPDSTPVGKKAKPGLLDRLGKAVGGGAASGAAGKVAGGWMFWAAIVCLVAGGLLLGFRVWGPGAIVAAIGLVFAALQWGVGFGFKWYTALVAVYVILWAVSLATRFPFDNYIIYLGSVVWLLLAAFGQAGGTDELPRLTWGCFQALLVFAVAPALWRQPAIPARWLIMGGLWLLLLFTH